MKPKPSKSALRSQFAGITNTSDDVATSFLEKNNWDVQEAMHSFFSSPVTPAQSKRGPDKALEAIFNKYTSVENPAIILIDGTLAYLDDLGIEPENPICLTLAFLLESPQTGEFFKEPFLRVWGDHKISKLKDMRSFLEQRHLQLMESAEFEQFYQYVFDFVRGLETRIKAIAHEEAVLYWQMLFGEKKGLEACQGRLSQWYEFVAESQRNISKDTWNMFYKLLVQVVAVDPEHLSGYDEMSAWPSMVDEYMEWLEEKGLHKS